MVGFCQASSYHRVATRTAATNIRAAPARWIRPLGPLVGKNCGRGPRRWRRPRAGCRPKIASTIRREQAGQVLRRQRRQVHEPGQQGRVEQHGPACSRTSAAGRRCSCRRRSWVARSTSPRAAGHARADGLPEQVGRAHVDAACRRILPSERAAVVMPATARPRKIRSLVTTSPGEWPAPGGRRP